jgi:acetyltransferase-like isoleucine patch superfamily enzyme
LAGAVIGRDSSIGRGVFFQSNLLSVGDNVRIGAGSWIDNTALVEIGDWVRIGPQVAIITASHSVLPSGPFRRTHGDLMANGVVIKRGCWICARALILPGVTIAEGCVIAAGAVVHQDTVPNGKYVGNPAKLVGIYPAVQEDPAAPEGPAGSVETCRKTEQGEFSEDQDIRSHVYSGSKRSNSGAFGS